jgi:hypothetical protein
VAAESQLSIQALRAAIVNHGENWEAIAFELDAEPEACQHAAVELELVELPDAAPPAADIGRMAELVNQIRVDDSDMRRTQQMVVAKAIAIGKALLELQGLVPSGEWTRFANRELPFSISTAKQYVRLAVLEDHVSDELSIAANLKLVAGLQRSYKAVQRQPEAKKREARRLWATGAFSFSEIARMLGTTARSVHTWVDPAYADHVRDQVAANERTRRGNLRRQANESIEHTYGPPGRNALGQAYRAVAEAHAPEVIAGALEVLEAIAAAWREELEADS